MSSPVPPPADMQDAERAPRSLLPKSILEGDEVWAWDDTRHRWRWARVKMIRWAPGRGRYHCRYEGVRQAANLIPRARYWVRRGEEQ